MASYVHYLLIKPEYQGNSIGKILLNKIREHYKNYLRIIIVAYDNEIGFYENRGFEEVKDASPMFISKLWT